MPKSRAVHSPSSNRKPRQGPPPVTHDETAQPVLQERLVRIQDATVEEVDDFDENEIPRHTKTLWLLLEDVETGAIFRSPLSLEDIQRITNMSRQLQGREVYKFQTALKMRSEPLRLVVDLSQKDVDADMILARQQAKAKSEEDVEKELRSIGLSKAQKAKKVSRFQFDASKATKLQNEINNEDED